MGKNQDFTIFGHRGCMGVDDLGENTVPAFERALQDGADGLEFDVYATHDTGDLVVMHDDYVDRTTNGQGHMHDLTFAELRALRVGNELTQTTDQYQHAVPTVAEVLDVAAHFSRTTGHNRLINIELKGPGTVEPIAELIETYARKQLKLSQFIISSFDHDQLTTFAELFPEVTTAVLVDDYQILEAGNSLEFAIRLAHKLGSVAVNTGLEFTDAAEVRQIHDSNLRSYIWTYSLEQDTMAIKDLGADGMFANNAGASRTLLASQLRAQAVH